MAAFYYHDQNSAANNSLLIYEYKWDAATNMFYINGQEQVNVSISNTLHIDGDSKGNFMVVYDDNNSVYGWAGRVDHIGHTMNYPVPAKLYLTSTQPMNGNNPDIALTFNGATTNPTAHVCYISTNGTLRTRDFKLTGPASMSMPQPIASFTAGITVSPFHSGSAFTMPRIACDATTNSKHFTVAVMEGNYIEAYNGNGASSAPAPVIYNDHTNFPATSPADLFAVQNYFPMLSYDATGNLWVGWVIDNRNNYLNNTLGYNAQINSAYPIVLKCDNTALPIANPLQYWEVPNTFTFLNNSVSNFTCPAIAGRHTIPANNILLFLSFLDDQNTQDVLTKTIFNVNNTSNFKSLADLNLPENKVTVVSLKLYDLSGKMVTEQQVNEVELQSILKQNNTNLPAGIYIAAIFNKNGIVNQTRKIYIGY